MVKTKYTPLRPGGPKRSKYLQLEQYYQRKIIQLKDEFHSNEFVMEMKRDLIQKILSDRRGKSSTQG